MVKRGDIWLVHLDPTVGGEIQKTRLCVVISPEEMNDYRRTVSGAPMTTGSHPAPFRIPVHSAGRDGLILLDQVRVVDKVRFAKRVGTLPRETLSATLATLREMYED